jgi:hypothetical protein
VLVRDQKRRNVGLERLMYTVECSLAPAYRPVQRNAEIGAVLDKFSVLISNRGVARLWPVWWASINGDSQTLACLIERLVNAILPTKDDRKISPVPLNQTT